MKENMFVIFMYGIIIAIILLCLSPLFIQYINGNKQLFDTQGKFTKAIITIGNEKLEINIKTWKDYEGEQLQITSKDGKVYLVSSFNTVLIKD